MEHLKENRGDYVVYMPVKKGTFKNNHTNLQISVEYTKGGMNYFSGKVNPRGYRVSVRPCTKTAIGLSFVLMSGDQREMGGYSMIETANRLSRKRLAELAELIDPKVKDIFNAVVKDEIGIFKELCKVGRRETVEV